jgi:hypothetical protein
MADDSTSQVLSLRLTELRKARPGSAGMETNSGMATMASSMVPDDHVARCTPGPDGAGASGGAASCPLTGEKPVASPNTAGRTKITAIRVGTASPSRKPPRAARAARLTPPRDRSPLDCAAPADLGNARLGGADRSLTNRTTHGMGEEIAPPGC